MEAGCAVDNTGECCICGNVGKLTFEHVPPAAAFNDRRVFQAKIDELLGGKWIPGEPMTRGKYVQRGAGRHSLCGKCNNDTGAWYGTPYVDFARQAMVLLHRSDGKMSLAYPYRIFPLRVLKQIVVMFFSACGHGLRKAHPELVKFVLDRERSDRSGRYPILGVPARPSGIHVNKASWRNRPNFRWRSARILGGCLSAVRPHYEFQVRTSAQRAVQYYAFRSGKHQCVGHRLFEVAGTPGRKLFSR